MLPVYPNNTGTATNLRQRLERERDNQATIVQEGRPQRGRPDLLRCGECRIPITPPFARAHAGCAYIFE